MEITEQINYKVNYSEEDISHAYYSEVVEQFLNKEFSDRKDEIKKLVKNWLDENTKSNKE